MSRLHLVAASDDFLLEQGLRGALVAAAAELQDADPEVLPDGVTPDSLAVEVCSPSLFSPRRILVVNDVRPWLDTTRPPGSRPAVVGEADVGPLLATLAEGMPEGVALVMGAWCGRKPRGLLVDLASRVGSFRWIPAPAPPKPWEDAVLSGEQTTLLRDILREASGAARFTQAAERLLMERLGFAPRHFAQEVRKLVVAAAGSTIDDTLVRALTFPRERSLDAVRDAALSRKMSAIFDILAASDAGLPVRDRSGRAVKPDGLGPVILSTLGSLFTQMLFVRRLAAAVGISSELDPKKTHSKNWYNRFFASTLAPRLEQKMREGMSFPISRKGKQPTTFVLGQLFAGASLYSDRCLIRALARAGDVEERLRASMPFEALSAWLASLVEG